MIVRFSKNPKKWKIIFLRNISGIFKSYVKQETQFSPLMFNDNPCEGLLLNY